MKWKNINNLPRSKKQLCLFIEWHELNQTSIKEYVGTFEEVLINREYEVKHSFTHWVALTKPTKK